jgi:hypothetical protein
VPDSFGKRNHEQVKARKAAEREERRTARAKRRRARANGEFVEPPGSRAPDSDDWIDAAADSAEDSTDSSEAPAPDPSVTQPPPA